jgi:hypothetical protein
VTKALAFLTGVIEKEKSWFFNIDRHRLLLLGFNQVSMLQIFFFFIIEVSLGIFWVLFLIFLYKTNPTHITVPCDVVGSQPCLQTPKGLVGI